MSCATDFLRRITGTILVLVVAVLGCLIVASAASADPPPGLVQAHGYDAPNYDQPTTYTATQRGPPAAHVSTAVSAGQRAVDRPSFGALARSDAPSNSNYTTYDVPTSLAQVDNSTGTTARSAVAIGGDLSSLQRAQAAAKNEHSLLQRALADRRLNPERGSIGGGGFTGSTTGHGAERLAEAGFDDLDVAILRGGQTYEQTDGATAFVTSAGRNTYNMMVQNADGAIVTAHRGMSYDDLAGLARNFGWSGW